MAKNDKIATMVRFTPETRGLCEMLAEGSNTSINSVVVSLVEKQLREPKSSNSININYDNCTFNHYEGECKKNNTFDTDGTWEIPHTK